MTPSKGKGIVLYHILPNQGSRIIITNVVSFNFIYLLLIFFGEVITVTFRVYTSIIYILKINKVQVDVCLKFKTFNLNQNICVLDFKICVVYDAVKDTGTEGFVKFFLIFIFRSRFYGN